MGEDNHHTETGEAQDQDYSHGSDTLPPLYRRRFLKGAAASPLAAAGLPAAADEAAAQQTSDEDWPQFQFDTGNTGLNPNGTGPTTGVGTLWNPFSTGGHVTSPVVMNGVIYVGSGDGNVYAVDAADGSQQWSFGTGGTVWAPAVDAGTVYVGSRGGHVHALDASDGTEQWRWAFPKGGASAAPTVANGVVYAPGADDRFFALDASDGSERWRVFTDECLGGQVQTPAVVDGVVYITEDCGKTWALTASDGSVQWKFDDGSGRGQASPPTVVDGTVYFGTVEADSPEGNEMIAVDAATGTEQWRFTFTPEGDVKSSPAAANGTVFFGSDNGNVYALNASDGTKVWEFATGGKVSSSPAVVNGVVYVGSNDGNLYLFDASTGDAIDCFEAGDALSSSPAVANGNVYVGSRDSNLYGLQEGEGGGCPQANEAPTAAFDFTPDDPVVGEEISFDASGSSDPDGSISTFEWDFDGDETFEETGEQVSHIYSEAGDFSATLRVTDDDGAEDTITKTVSVDKLDLGLDDTVRLVQTVEDSEIIGGRDSVPDPDHVGGRQSIVGFGLNGDENKANKLFDNGNLSDIKFALFFNDSQSPDETFKLKEDKIPDIIDRGIVDETALGGGAGDLHDLFVNRHFPTIEMKEELEKITLTVPKTDQLPESSRMLFKSEDYSFSTTPELNLAFIPIRDSEGGTNYGTDGNGGPKSYEPSTEDILKYLDKAYPVTKVNAYLHNPSDPVLGTSDEEEYPFDLKEARDELEIALQNLFPLSSDNPFLNGKLLTVKNGEIIEHPENVLIDSIDEWVAIVPGGTNEHYFEFHQRGEGTAGVHLGEESVPGDFQPQTTSAVLEKAASPYDPTTQFNYGVGEIGAHEIGHHFMDDPYSGSFADLSGEKPNGEDDPDHAHDNLISTKLDLEKGQDSKLEVRRQTDSIMDSGDNEPLWPDEHAYQQLIESQFNPHPRETAENETQNIIFSASVKISDVLNTAEIVDTTVRVGKTIASAVDTAGDIVVNIKDAAEDTLEQTSINNQVTADFFSATATIEGIGLGTIPFPQETYRVEFEVDGNTAVIIPIVKSLFDAVSAIPDNGLKHVPDQRRRALNEKLEEIKEKMKAKEFQDAKQKLKNDFRTMIEKWLKDEYEAAANEFTKQEMLNLVDDMIARLETLIQESS